MSEPTVLQPPGQKVRVDGIDIHYERMGNGPEVFLLLSGGLGFSLDFAAQLNGLDPKLFTLIAWDPPGYGFSRPPDRTFPKGFYHRDATVAHNLMKKLNFEKFSLLGWCAGGITSLILAAKYPNSVQRLIEFAAHAWMSDKDMVHLKQLSNVDVWSPSMRDPMLRVYGETYLRDTWTAQVKAYEEIYSDGGNICKEVLDDIKCPTLIVHGTKDPVISVDHAVYIHERIKNSRLEMIAEGKHDLHIRCAAELNALVEKFVREN